jgi:hypothetical protein
MATKLGRKEMPSGLSADDFKYQGRPAVDQDDFSSEVGIADMVCVNQFGESNNNKYYHAGVVTANGSWFVYLEWGRVSGGGKTWDGNFQGQDFQFVQCNGEDDARAFFEKQARSKNIKRLQEKKIGGKTIWVGKAGKDGYVVQRLATRTRGLPDATLIKDDTGVAKKATKKKATKKRSTTKKIDAQPQVIALAKSLVGGTADYARAASKAAGVTPTMEAIAEVRDDLIPQALEIIKKVGDDQEKQLKSKKLQDLSTYVATIVPRPIPRTGDASAVILNSSNIFLVQQDLDAFEAALKNEDWETEIQDAQQVDPNKVLGRNMTWIDPKSDHGRWVAETYVGMTNNRHGHLRGGFKVINMFAVEDVAKRKAFIARAATIAKNRKGERHERAGLQPKRRIDVSDISDIYDAANICIGIHGTRAVNVQPILSSNLRLPKSLKGVHITGAAFGHGIYFATDIKKSHGYTGDGYYGGGGSIKSRGFFMFLCDLTVGKAHMARSTMWNQVDCPRGADSIFAKRGKTSVQNDEHVIFDPNQQFIRYVIEAKIGR